MEDDSQPRCPSNSPPKLKPKHTHKIICSHHVMMDQQQPPPPLTSSSNDIMSTDNPVAASVVVKPSNDDEIIEETSVAASSPIFHVLLLPGGNLQTDSDADKANNNKTNSNVIDIIDDYLYQRHVYRKQAAARRLRPGGGGVGGGAEKVNDETPHHHHDDSDINISLNLVALASPLEVALVSCCVRVRHTATATITAAATKDTSTSQSSISRLSPSSSTQRSRLHRPILPSNYLADDEGDEHEHEQTVSLDTPRTISMKIHDPYNNGGNSGNSKEVGTLRKGQEAHFLKLLQMYCPQCKKGVMYRSLVVEILQRTADWESESVRGRASDSGAHSNNDVGGGATATAAAADIDMSVANNSSNNHNNSRNNHNNNNASIGQVGYTFRKQFHSGWYIGKVTEIIPNNTIRGTSTTVKDRRCVYNDGDEEDLSLEELKYLAELEELDRYHHDDDCVGDNDDDKQKINTEDEEDLSLEELKYLAELEELDQSICI